MAEEKGNGYRSGDAYNNRKSGGGLSGLLKGCAIVVIILLLLGLILSILTCSGVLSNFSCCPNKCDCTCVDCVCCSNDNNPPSWNQESKDALQDVSYSSLSREIEAYVGKKVLLSGQVISVTDKGKDNYEIVVDISSNNAGWKVLLVYKLPQGEPKVVQGDTVQFIAKVVGTTSDGVASKMPKLEVILLTIL